jgi:radical SAM superfamily enzyme YgiQ (UPF0313 family)
LGVASIASSLRSIGVDVRIISDAVNRPDFSTSDFFSAVTDAVDEAGSGVLVGIAAFVWCEPEVQCLLKVLGSRASIVLGGPQVSYVATGELEEFYPNVAYFVRGHGESAMVMLATGRVENGAFGLHVAGLPDLGTRADFPLEHLPSPHLDGTAPVGDFVRWETQRGCSFSCSFCQHRQPGARLLRSRMGVDRLHRELLAFHAAGAKRIAVLDPIFNTDNERAVGLLDEVSRVGVEAGWSFQCRFEFVNESFLDAVAPLDATLEFGLQTVHDDEARAVGRPNRIDRVESVIAELNARRIPYEVSLIYGLPLQTLDRFRRSVDWCLERGVPRVRAWPLMLLRGTVLHAQRQRWGYVESDDRRIPVVVESSSFTRGDHTEMARIADSLSGPDSNVRGA